MIIALYALSFAMIVGGVFAAILGWDIVLVERGWTMVLAGSISAASGALLLGIASVVSRLSQIQSELMHIQTSMVEELEEPSVLPAAAGVSLAALAGGLFGKKAADTADRPQDFEEPQPALPLFPEAEKPVPEDLAVAFPPDHIEPAAQDEAVAVAPRSGFDPKSFFKRRPEPEPEIAEQAEPLEPEASPTEDVSEVKVPDFLIAERFEARYMDVRSPEPEAELPSVEPERETLLEEPEEVSAEPADDVFEPETPQPEAEAAVSEEAEAPTVIGSYNSGDNRYVMFSDGSIEAETPQGMFRFHSLDELKGFISSGEGGTRIT